MVSNKHPAEHHELQQGGAAGAENEDVTERARRNLPEVYKDVTIDPETAQYLDGSIVIDEAENKRIKRIVSAGSLPLLGRRGLLGLSA